MASMGHPLPAFHFSSCLSRSLLLTLPPGAQCKSTRWWRCDTNRAIQQLWVAVDEPRVTMKGSLLRTGVIYRMQLSVNNVTMRYGARILFEDVNTTFIAGRRYAITGPNGAGKSTLMKILTGEIDP